MRTLTLLISLLASGSMHADVPVQDLKAAGDASKRYFLIGDTKAVAPKSGFKLAIIMPGGDGGADFHDFVKSIATDALPKNTLVVQPVAFKWIEKQEIVWPLTADKSDIPSMKFTTEEFIAAMLNDVMTAHTIDRRHVVTLSWSSSGPAAYAIAASNPMITGSVVAMSVYHPERMPKLDGIKGKSIFIYHSPDDKICKYYHAISAKKALTAAGGIVTIVDYDGGHGWHGATLDDLRTGFEWLEKQAPPAKK
jgi:predicted esterase